MKQAPNPPQRRQVGLLPAMCVWTLLAVWFAVVAWGGMTLAVGTVAVMGLAMQLFGEFGRRPGLTIAGGIFFIAGIYIWAVAAPFVR